MKLALLALLAITANATIVGSSSDEKIGSAVACQTCCVCNYYLDHCPCFAEHNITKDMCIAGHCDGEALITPLLF